MSTIESQVSKREIILTQIEHTRLYFLHEVTIDNHRLKTFVHEVMIGNHRNKTTESCWEHITT